MEDPSCKLENHNNNIPKEIDLVAEIQNNNITPGDENIDVKEELIPGECLPVEDGIQKIEITEHSLALESMPALEDIYKTYNKNQARYVFNKSQTSPKIGEHSTEKRVKKAKSLSKKVIQKNTLDNFVYKSKVKIERVSNKKVFPDMVERLFIRLERIDISDKLDTASANGKDLKVSEENNVGTDQRNEQTVHRPTKRLKLSKLPTPVEEETADDCVINKRKKCIIKAMSMKSVSKYNKLFIQNTPGIYTSDDNEVPEQIFGKYLPLVGTKKGLDSNQLKKKVAAAEYQCYHCNAVCYRRKYMVHHMNKWHRGPRKEVSKQEFQCYHCGKVVKYRKSLINHLTQWHTKGEKKYHCDSCTYRTNLKQALLVHVYRVHVPDDQKPTYKCDFCPHVTKFKADLRFHMNRVHLKKKKIKKCDQCNWEGDGVRLADHKRHQHSGQEVACDKCSFKTRNKASLAAHTRKHSEEKPFSCPKCPYKSRYSLRDHLKTHEYSFKKCPECSQVIKENGLSEHIRRRHRNRRKEKCPQCAKELFSLKKHLQTHNGGHTKIKCPDCSFTCSSSHYLKIHIRECHENVKRKPVTCYQCNKELLTKQNLIYHLRTVHATNPCDCPVCGVTLSSKMYLSAHVRRVHAPLMECDLCPEGSRYKTKNTKRFERHKVLHLTGEEVKMYTCDYCPYKNKVLPNLHRHLVRHHKRESKQLEDKA